MTPVFVRSGKHPVVVGLLVALVAISIYGLTTSPPTKAVDLALPYPQRLIWSLQIVITCSVTLLGIAWRDPFAGMKVEQLGWFGVFAGLSCYEVMLWSTTPWNSAGFVFCLVMGIAVGAAYRVYQIGGDVRKYRQLRALVA